MTNYYKILGVADFASEQEIKIAHRKLSKKFHPDGNDGDPFFNEKFKELQDAYEQLSNEETKVLFDENLRNYQAHATADLNNAKDHSNRPVNIEQVNSAMTIISLKYMVLMIKLFTIPGQEIVRAFLRKNIGAKAIDKRKIKATIILLIIIAICFFYNMPAEGKELRASYGGAGLWSILMAYWIFLRCFWFKYKTIPKSDYEGDSVFDKNDDSEKNKKFSKYVGEPTLLLIFAGGFFAECNYNEVHIVFACMAVFYCVATVWAELLVKELNNDILILKNKLEASTQTHRV